MKTITFRIKSVFLLNLLYGTSISGFLIQYSLYLVYIFLLAYLFQPETAVCMPETEITTEEYNQLTANIDRLMNTYRTDYIDFLKRINALIPTVSQIDLKEMGVLTIKKSYSAFPTLFPLNSLGDYSPIIPYQTQYLDPISAYLVEALRNPNYTNIEMSGTFINRLYLEALDDLTSLNSTKELKLDAWKRIIYLIPPAMELQVKSINHFLGIINYPYKVEDLYDGSAYQRANMFDHAGMMSAYDPYGLKIPEQDIVQTYILEEMEKKKISFIIPSLLKDPWNTVQVEPAPMHANPFTMDDEDIENKRRVLDQTKQKFNLEKSEILKKKMELLQDKMAHARTNQMLVHAGVIVCTGTIIGIAAGVGYQIYKAKYGI